MNPLAKFLAVFYVLLVVGVAASAAYVWQIRCESFGCTGIGVAWFAWTLLFLFVLALGLAVKHLARLSASIRRTLRWGIVAQLIVAVFLASAWILHKAA